MDPTSTVRTDAIPAIATVVAPGAAVSTPYLWAVLSRVPQSRNFLDRHEAIALSGAILIWVISGFVIESLGSYVEVYWIDRRRADHKQVLETWWQYLRIAWDTEPIGQHYLRRLLVSFKFELNMCVAALGSIPGVLALGLMSLTSALATASGVIVLLVSAAALFRAARDTAGVLAELRSCLVQGVGEPPFSANGEPIRR